MFKPFNLEAKMKLNSTKKIALALAMSAGLTGLANTARADADPMNFYLPNGWVTYGDAQSYALQVGCVVGGFTGTGCPFYVASGPGQIQDLVVNGTGSSGGPVTTNFPGMDNAYATPNSPNNPSINQLSDWFFRTGGQTVGSVTFSASDPGGAGQFARDYANTWDTTLTALKSFLTDLNGLVRDPVIFFNNNQTNSGASVNQHLAAWAQLWITNPNGAVIGTWDFTNRNSLYAPPPNGGGVILGDVTAYTATQGVGPAVNVNTSNPLFSTTDYVLSGGEVCLSATNQIVACGTPGARAVNNNLGANQAAYALIFPEMNALLQSLWNSDLTGYTLHADIRLGCDPAWYGGAAGINNDDLVTASCMGKRLTNGYEQIFMGRLAGYYVPEPSGLALAALGLFGLGFIGRRRRQG